MRIQNACSTCCAGIKEFASVAASKIGNTMSAVGHCIGESARKVADFAKPHFQNLKTFAQENKQPIIIAAVAFAIGVILTALMTRVFSKGASSSSEPVPTSGTA